MKLGKVQILGTLKHEPIEFVSKKTGQKEKFEKQVLMLLWGGEAFKATPARGCTFIDVDLALKLPDATVVSFDTRPDVPELVLKF